jgi:squalene-hopene/tetraprenyl-beta-curcumene cyclase
MKVDEIALDKTLKALKERLIRSRLPVGCWEGKLSGSALSTATAVFALAMVDKKKYAPLIRNGINWLIENHNSDGGWGDTVKSLSNISTTMLAFSALTVAEESERCREAVAGAEAWLADFAAHLEPGALVEAVVQQYGRDRSFSAPILTMCALAGRLSAGRLTAGDSQQAWRRIKPLPFELAICPHQLFKWLRLPVVSYALPALIAIGQASYHFRRPKNPVLRALRHFSRRKTLDVLRSLQPENGGFLEAAPLTSFVVMSLAAIGQKDNEVVSKGTGFLVASAREDGSWPIDTNLAAWVTTLSINALAAVPDFESLFSEADRRQLKEWLLKSQYRRVHPYTHAAPGGWAWTDLPGAVPDADDTAGALVALRNLGAPDQVVTDAAIAGINWLLGLQNSDGGIPTFCRGWSALPFDRSAPDLTAHALGAIGVWLDVLPGPLQKRAGRAVKKGLAYLECAQRQDGSWVPLWFGNQFAANQENPVYGTARVLTGLQRLGREYIGECAEMFGRAVGWLLSVQNQDGGWGGDKSVGSSVEETALAVDGLCAAADSGLGVPAEQVWSAVSNGVSWLVEQTKEDGSVTASPIGLYFARLWYFEELYPVIFAVSALQKAKNIVNSD